MKNKETNTYTRRRFIETSGVAAIGAFSIVSPQVAFGSLANSKIRLGIIGTGGRGTWIARLFREHGGYEIVAGADYFQDQVDSFGKQMGVPANKIFTGLSSYKRLIDSGVDAIAIESPPYFHPEQAAAGVDAGKHVFLSKPIAVDVPGTMSVEKSGQMATKKNLCFLVDFQTRAQNYFKEAVRRVHQGDIGEFVFGESTYHAGFPFPNQSKALKSDPQNVELQLRAWGISTPLSGDIITEQNIHTLDVMSWIMNQDPISVYGTHGHNVRDDIGSCSDHFTLIYKYPDNVSINFSSYQFQSPDRGGIKNRMFGTKGVIETEYGGQVRILGEKEYKGGDTGPIYQEGAVNNIATFFTNIAIGNYKNETVSPSVTSNLVTIMGRDAAYKKKEILWDDLVKSKEKLEPNLKGLKS